MIKTYDYWDEKINSQFKEWKIGTNISTYINNTICKWLFEIDENDQIIFDDKSEPIVWFENKPDLVFYHNKKDNKSSSTTIDQIRRTLESFDLLVFIEGKYKINKNLLQKVKSSSSPPYLIVKEFILDNIKQCLEKNILRLFDEDSDSKCSSNFNIWWTIVRILDSDPLYKNHFSKDLIGMFPFLKIKVKGYKFYEGFIRDFLCNEEGKLDRRVITNVNGLIEQIGVKTNLISTNWASNTHIDFTQFEIKHNKNLANKLDQADSQTQAIKGFETTLNEFFSADLKYNLPIFQRTYSWDSYMINNLFETLWSDFKEGNNQSLLNNIILGKGRKTNIIDGQQRVSSLIIILVLLAKFFYWIKPKTNEKELDICKEIEVALSTPIFKSKEIISRFKEIDANYETFWKLITTKEESDEDKNTSFYKNWKEISKIIKKKLEPKLEYSSILETIKNFLNHILNKTFFVISYIKSDDPKQEARLFTNLNKNGKKLGVLDLFRNKLNEAFHKSEYLKVYIKLFNKTINLYFRKNNKPTRDEDLSLIINFLDNTIIKTNNKVEPKYHIDINKIDEDYGENVANAYKKIESLWNLYEHNQPKGNNIIQYFWENIIEFHYCKYGNLNQIKSLTSDINIEKENNDEQSNSIKHLANEINKIQDITRNYEKIIKNIKYINFQIYHISNGGNKKVFIPLVWLLINHFNILSGEAEDKNKTEFSKHLVEIEKFSLLWKLKFAGQSLTKRIWSICDHLKEKNNLISSKELYERLEATIPEISDQNFSKTKKIKELYELLETKYNFILQPFHYTKGKLTKTIESNLNYKIILGRVACVLMDAEPWEYPHYFQKQTNEQQEYNKDFVFFSYDHKMPQKGKVDNLLKSGVKKSEIDSVIYKIGNGSLIPSPDNSAKGNKIKTSESSNVTNQINDIKSKFKLIDFKNLNDKVISSESKNISLGGFKELSYTNKEVFNDFKKSVEERSKNIIESYISILFYDWIEDETEKPLSN